ncbi:MAG TPA: acetoacetate--CoA ligase [Polyangiaceae bacterium]|nr:acetoacetate--CoA ligase [Polyangiaceae bacterium]
MSGGAPSPVYEPPAGELGRSQLGAFLRFCEGRLGRALGDEAALYRFSVDEGARFWGLFAAWAGLRLSGEREPVIGGEGVERAAFFPRARLSYVDHLVRPPGGVEAPAGATAVIGLDEAGAREELTRGELARRVGLVAAALARRGVGPGDRVLGLCRNTPRTLVAYLATLSLGATWSAAAPDMGAELVLARAGQVAPKLLFADARYPYHGATRDNRERLAALAAKLPSLERVVALDDAPLAIAGVEAEPFERLLGEGAGEAEGAPAEFDFNHPLLVLFSSGTTGVPKCIVHGAGGTLLEHLKELRLHCDLGPRDRLLFHTTAGWMMYNWLVSALATGATVVLYDGSVTFPEADSLFSLVARERVTVFGTSAAYLGYCRDEGLEPGAAHDLSALRLVCSTGSVLADPLYDWAAEKVARVPLHSISGGTDIVGCFVMGSPGRPVYRGESPSIGLGLDVRAARREGSRLLLERCPAEGSVRGELVCAAPFPSRPLGLYGDEGGKRFHEAYFSQHEGVWTHGDAVELTSRGTARILGRSDGVLNVRGVRIGPGEIYRVLEAFPEVRAAAAVEQKAPGELGGSRLVLLVVMAERGSLTRPLTLKIKKELSTRASPAHVPELIVEVSDLPRTHNGKLSERAARDAVNGLEAANRDALKNAEVLGEIMAHPAIAAAREGGEG